MLSLISRLTVILVVFATNSLQALTEEQILSNYEQMGEWQTAYRMDCQRASRQNTFAAWQEIATRYADYQTNAYAYLRAWLHAKRINQPESYKAFIAIRPDTALSAQAIHAIYQHVEQQNTPAAYIRFMEEFPGSVEALQALLRLQSLAFSKARRLDTTAAYDAFITAFPGAEQTPDALEAAFASAKQATEQKLAGFSDIHRIEAEARRIWNEGRLAERADNLLIATRNYRLLLEIDTFKSTRVLTELLDREERQAYQKLMLAKQTELKNTLTEMQEALIETITVRTQALEDTIQKKSNDLESLLTAHNTLLTDQLRQISAHVNETDLRRFPEKKVPPSHVG